MTLDEAEEVFGHPRAAWSERERTEFLAALEPEQLRVPGVLAWALQRPGALPADCQAWLLAHGFPLGPERATPPTRTRGMTADIPPPRRR
jgi:hypothetical protein